MRYEFFFRAVRGPVSQYHVSVRVKYTKENLERSHSISNMTSGCPSKPPHQPPLFYGCLSLTFSNRHLLYHGWPTGEVPGQLQWFGSILLWWNDLDGKIKTDIVFIYLRDLSLNLTTYSHNLIAEYRGIYSIKVIWPIFYVAIRCIQEA